jgi:hypothetical protein
MTVIKFYSNTHSFADFVANTKLKDVKAYEKGTIWLKRSKRRHDCYRLNIGFSERDWDNVDGQIKDAIKFLKWNKTEIKKVFKGRKISDAYLDFPSYATFSKSVVIHQQCFNPELLKICGSLNLSINLCLYN